jgi:hypothetical protein
LLRFTRKHVGRTNSFSTGNQESTGFCVPNPIPTFTIAAMTQTQKFSPEQHRQFLDAQKVFEDEARSDVERLDACSTVIDLCTSPIPSSPNVDPLPYCPGWLDVFGRAHDLREELREKERKKTPN